MKIRLGLVCLFVASLALAGGCKKKTPEKQKTEAVTQDMNIQTQSDK